MPVEPACCFLVRLPAFSVFDSSFGDLQPHTPRTTRQHDPLKRLCTEHHPSTFMSGRTTPDNETGPLLGNQRTESYQTLVTNENAPKADDREAPGLSLAWILAALWSAVFLGALDGKFFRRLVQTGYRFIFVTTGTIVATLLSPIGAHFNRSNQSSYIGTAYLLSVCCFTPLYGRLSDILGRKGAMLLALSLFGSGTLCVGLRRRWTSSLLRARSRAWRAAGQCFGFTSFVVGRSQCLCFCS